MDDPSYLSRAGATPGFGEQSLRYAVLDVETTGLRPEESNIVEIAIIELDECAQVISEWSSLVRAPGQGELGATHIHGITRSMVDDAPTLSDFADEITERIQGRIIVGHVIEFDLAHLACEFSRIGRGLPNVGSVSVCTRDLARRQLRFKPLTLRNCCEQLGIAVQGAHSALGDTRATVALFQHLFAKCDPAWIQHKSANLGLLSWSVPMFAGLHAAALPRRP